MTTTSAVSLNSILSNFVAKRVSLQQLCDKCKGTNDECDYCTVLRHRPLRDKLETTGIVLKRFKDDTQEDDYGYRNSFLTGSNARRTGTRPPKDVDFFLVLDEEQYGDGSRLAPADLLERLQSTLEAVEGTEIFGNKIKVVELQHRSVRVVFEDDFHVDIIPAFETAQQLHGREVYEIPDAKLGKYIMSNPKIHGDLLRSAVSESELPKLRDIIKLARRWKRDAFQEGQEKPKSFHLEMVAIELLRGQTIGGYLETLERYFTELPKYFASPRMPDPACPAQGTQEQWVDAYVGELTNEQRAVILQRIHEARDILGQARKLESEGRIVPAIEMLRVLYPDLPEQSPETALKKERAAQSSPTYANSRGPRPWNATSKTMA